MNIYIRYRMYHITVSYSIADSWSHGPSCSSRCAAMAAWGILRARTFYIFLRNSCGSFAENCTDLRRLSFSPENGQQALRIFAETTSPRQKQRRETSKSWLVKFPLDSNSNNTTNKYYYQFLLATNTNAIIHTTTTKNNNACKASPVSLRVAGASACPGKNVKGRNECSFILTIIYPPLKQMGGCFWLFLQAQKGDTYFTELAERVEYGNYEFVTPYQRKNIYSFCSGAKSCLHSCILHFFPGALAECARPRVRGSGPGRDRGRIRSVFIISNRKISN